MAHENKTDALREQGLGAKCGATQRPGGVVGAVRCPLYHHPTQNITRWSPDMMGKLVAVEDATERAAEKLITQKMTIYCSVAMPPPSMFHNWDISLWTLSQSFISIMRPSMRVYTAQPLHPAVLSVASRSSTVPKRVLLPTLAWLGAASVVSLYISQQLGQGSSSFDRIFAQQNTPEVEQARKRDLLVDTYGDPRNSLLNVLGWTN
ncbi:hypothetical protein F5Y18DRAFT_431664 [Xylariaceae sp. FL1019]|nr:hypothetical protein F5Y18DRAFT_431664 [Xylariaceae sp. FL1019]